MCWTTYTRQYRISVRRLMSLHMFVVNVIVAFFLFFIFYYFFYQRFVGLSRTPKQYYFARDQVCR